MPSNYYPFIAREAWPTIITIFGATIFAKFFLSGPIFIFLLIVLLTTIFLFRDPHRNVPSQPLAVVSPVHGIISKVGEAKERSTEQNGTRAISRLHQCTVQAIK